MRHLRYKMMEPLERENLYVIIHFPMFQVQDNAKTLRASLRTTRHIIAFFRSQNQHILGPMIRIIYTQKDYTSYVRLHRASVALISRLLWWFGARDGG